jgi:hypothetical protein
MGAVRLHPMREAFPEFVRLRGRWFTVVFVVNVVVGLILIGQRYHSAVEVVGLALLFSLVATTLISLLSAPVVFLIARRRGSRKESKP